jgi:RNA polymerase sigma-70 factor (ECF subfamily)
MLSAPEREPSPSDAELLARMGARETAALAALYDRHASHALGVAHRVLRDRSEAEEVVQDLFLQLWNAPSRYDARRGKFTSWLFVMARNRALDRLRQRATRARTHAEEAHEPPGPPADSGAEGRLLEGERRRSVQGALAQLPEGQRRAIELSFYRGLSQSEIARETGEPLGTVKSRMSRAMAALRQALEGAS